MTSDPVITLANQSRRNVYVLTESEFAHILSTFPLVGENVKAGVMREFGKVDSI